MTRYLILLALASASLSGRAQKGMVMDGVYVNPPAIEKEDKGYSHTLLFGSGRDFDFVHLGANAIPPGTRRKVLVPKNEEYLIFITSGSLTLSLADSVHTLVKGSLAMMMPSTTYHLGNSSEAMGVYHLMKYRSKLPVDIERGTSSGGSFVCDWTKLAFKSHDRGGVRSYFDRPTAMTKRFEVHVTTLNEGLPSHPAHTHPAEEIILVLDGNVEMLIGDKSYQAKAGDALYVTTNVLHGLKNIGAGACSYFAIQWE